MPAIAENVWRCGGGGKGRGGVGRLLHQGAGPSVAVDHTPQVPAQDDRPLRLLERTPVPDEHRERLLGLVRRAQEAAAALGKELQAEFGPHHVALIASCNQFVRLFRSGPEPGVVELLLPPEGKEALRAAGFGLREPEGAVFRLFGWVRIDPMQGPEPALAEAVEAALRKAAKA
jgi:hypothetical protein